MKTGDSAPDFTLKDAGGNNWTLSAHRGKTVVLLFYPGDNTPVCTKQLCSVRDNWADYAATGAEVVGISTDSAQSHRDFAEKHELPLTLLSDEKGATLEKYGVKSWLPNRSARAVVVIDKNGTVRHYQVQSLSLFRPKDDEVLEAIKAAQNN
jgi:peroxiredoxin Q/BCP